MYGAVWAYPWDLLDEGVDASLARMADAGLAAVSLAAVYHHVRALCPHNPRHAVVHGEGGVVYFQPDDSLFLAASLRPAVSALVREGDPLRAACKAAARRGLRVHAWTVLHHNSRLGQERPDCTIENAFGDRYPFALCPANPAVRAYSHGLVASMAAIEGLDTIEIEALGYMGIDHSGHHAKHGVALEPLHTFLLSVCFCPNCAARMVANGVDVERAREDTRQEVRGFLAGRHRAEDDDVLGALAEVLGGEQADGLLAARDQAVLTLLEELYWAVRDRQRLCVMVTGSPLATGAQAGLTLPKAREWTDRLLTQAFERDPDAVRERVADITVRRGSTPVFVGLQALPPFVDSPYELAAQARAAADAGADGLQFYHYGLMPLERLGWVRDALTSL